jgi:methionine-rich copper-binding protein CopC
MTFSTRHIFGNTPKAAFIIAILVLFLGVASVFAHARLLHSSPEDKAKLDKPPEKIEFWFNELLDEGFNTVDVYPAEELNATTHTNLAQGTPIVDPSDKTHLTVALKPISPGKYVVDYRVLSRDGHTAPGRVNFTVTESK